MSLHIILLMCCKVSGSLEFAIGTAEPSRAYSSELLAFIKEYYVAPQPEIFSNISIGKDLDMPTLSFLGIGPEKAWFIDTKVQISDLVQVRMEPRGPVPESA